MPFARNFLKFFLLLSLITLVDFIFLGKPVTGLDDANIFFTYARHLANGDGFVYNTGGQRVEGFTSMLWVLICSAFFSCTSHPEFLMLGFLLLLATITVTLLYEALRKDMEPGSWAHRHSFALFCAFLVCIGPSYLAWSVLSLMDNGIWNFIFTSVTIPILQSWRKTPVHPSQKAGLLLAGALLILSRPEGMAWGALFALMLLAIHYLDRKNLWFPILFTGTVTATAVSLTLFRLHYFGYPFPNTYYAKVSHNRWYNIANGALYALDFLTNYNLLITILLFALVVTVLSHLPGRRHIYMQEPGSRFARNGLLPVTIILIAGISLPLATGGDHFGGFRFYQHILPLFAWGIPALALLGSQFIFSKSMAAGKLLLVIAALVTLPIAFSSLLGLKKTPQTQMNYDFFLAKEGRRTGELLNDYWPGKKPSVGIIAAGGIALRYQGETIDLMGLNDTLMGHSKGDRIGIKNHAAFNKDVFYQLTPDLVLPKLVTGRQDALRESSDLRNPYNFDNQAMKDIFNDDRYNDIYTPVMLSKKGKESIFVYINNHFRQQLAADTSLTVTSLPVIK